MAHTKSKGSTKTGRESQSKRLGVKRFGGEVVGAGEVLARQRGTKWRPGENVVRGSDDTLYAKTSGQVYFKKIKVRRFDGQPRLCTFIGVRPK